MIKDHQSIVEHIERIREGQKRPAVPVVRTTLPIAMPVVSDGDRRRLCSECSFAGDQGEMTGHCKAKGSRPSCPSCRVTFPSGSASQCPLGLWGGTAGAIMPSRIVVLSLDSRPDRWATVSASIKSSKIIGHLPVERYRARPPSEMIVPDDWAWGDTIYATGRDHRDIIERSYAAGDETVLILEDDAVLQPNFDAAYAAACRNLPGDWMGLWLTSDGHKKRPTFVAPGVVRCTDQAMLHAYLLSRRGMHRVWHHLVTCHRQIVDGATEDLHGIEPHFYATAYNAVRQFGDRFIGERAEFYDKFATP